MRIEALRTLAGLLLVLAAALPVVARAELTISEGTNIAVDVAPSGQHVIDLIGGLWLVPPGGGTAQRLPNDLHTARLPRFAKDGQSIVYVAEVGQETELWIYDLATENPRPVARSFGNYEHPDWHPDGERIVFAADHDGSGYEIWEVDVPTGLKWRVTHGEGDSVWPSWSDDGRDLVYVRRYAGVSRLMLRRLGLPDEILLETDEPLSAPSFRPDKSLVTVTRHTEEGLRIDMVILSSPRLVRSFAEDDDIFVGRVAWQNRQRALYTAGGHIRQRPFNAFRSSNLGFVARIEPPELAPSGDALGRRLESRNAASRDIVIRARRLYTGLDNRYIDGVDILISGGQISAVEPSRLRPGQNVVDLGDITVMPGLIDVLADLPDIVTDSDGARLLGFGVTMLVTDREDAEDLDARWSNPATPGPRVLRARPLTPDVDIAPWLFLLEGDRSTGESLRGLTRRWQTAGVPVLAGNWQVGLGAGASLVLGGKALPLSPGGRRYADLEVTNGQSAVTFVSSLAHAGTAGLEDLFASRQAAGLSGGSVRHLANPSALAAGRSQVVLGSTNNGLPPGVAQQAELRALTDAGLTPHGALKAATVNAALALGLGLRTGRVATGAEANLVLVAGDPLGSVEDASDVVGVVLEGRFMSLGRLMDVVNAK